MTEQPISRFEELLAVWKQDPHALEGDVVREIAELIEAGTLGVSVNEYRPYEADPSFSGMSLLALFASKGCVPVVRALLQAGADPSLVTVDPSDPKTYAPIAHAGRSPQTVRILLAAGADVNAQSRNGDTALHKAAALGDVALVEELLKAGADPLVSHSGGRTPIQELIEGGEPPNPSILRMLREAAAPRIAQLKGSSVETQRRKTMYRVGEVFGARTLARENRDADRAWTVLAARARCEATAEAIATLQSAPRWEENAHKRLVPDARRFAPVVEFKRCPWSLVFSDDLARSDASALAREVSRKLEVECIFVFCELVKRYADGFAIEDHDWSEEAIGEQFDPDEDQAACDGERERMQDEYNAWLAKHEVLIPPYELYSTGYVCGITLHGIRKGDLGRADIIVLEEHRSDEPE